MLPRMCLSFDRLLHRKKKDDHGSIKASANAGQDLHRHSVDCIRKQRMSPAEFGLRVQKREYSRNEEERKKREMANRVVNISDLIHRVASSCFTNNPIIQDDDGDYDGDYDGDEGGAAADIEEYSLSSATSNINSHREEEEEEEEPSSMVLKKLREMESLTNEVFEAISSMRRAYVRLQEAHNPWDPGRMRSADEAVVGELRKLGRLRDLFRRGGSGGGGGGGGGGIGISSVMMMPRVREVVGPYEAALEEVKRELKAKETEIESLKEKLRTPTKGSGRKGRMQYGKRVGCISGLGTPLAAPTPELFETCMEEVKSASKSFTAHLLSLMRAAHWDIAAAARSIIENTAIDDTTTNHLTIPNVDPHHAKHALESYVTRKIFHGFENETFYIEGSLTSLLHPSEFRRDCFAQYRDMRSMDPGEILGILPTCQFGKFAGKKYLAIVHPRMEESLFGGTEQRRQVLAGTHPRTGFYGEYLRLAKAVWLLHLLAFALDPSPSHFEASTGAEFHPDYMESVVRLSTGARVGGGWVVGFSVGPGFKLGSGSVVRARVYLVPRV